jgi:5'-3' exonuclease
VVICSPDKDLAQSVRTTRVVTLDRRKNTVLDEAGVGAKFGVLPESIPDYLALVGDSADGIPGIPRWGAMSTARLLERYVHLDRIPSDAAQWEVAVRGAASMAAGLNERRRDALLYRELATLRLDVPLSESLEDLRWAGVPRRDYETLCDDLGSDRLRSLPHRWAADR